MNIKRKVNHWTGIILLISVICFLFYKSVLNETPFSDALNSIEIINNLQVQLHRDLLRYRNNQIQQYDLLNNTISKLRQHINAMLKNKVMQTSISPYKLDSLNTCIHNEEKLIEDFKTHLSIVKNSLSYLYKAANTIYSEENLYKKIPTDNTSSELITLLLEYNNNPKTSIAKRIYPLIDHLNHNPDIDTNSLIIHSLLMIERLPVIDNILNNFNTLNTEKQIINIKNTIIKLQKKQNEQSHIYNSLLFLFSFFLIGYIAYIFIRLRKNRLHLSTINNRLNNEVKQRTQTENALYKLVEIDDINNNEDDDIKNLLNAICNALNVCCAYISLIDKSEKNGEIVGIVCNHTYSTNIPFKLRGTPCEDVMKKDRLVFNKDIQKYYPDWDFNYLSSPEGYIGVSLNDKNRKIYGLLTVVDNKEIFDTVLMEGILGLAAPRAIIELHKQIESNNTLRYQRGLKLIDEWIVKIISNGFNQKKFYENICIAASEITQSQLAVFPVIKKSVHECYFISAAGIDANQLYNTRLPLKADGLCAWTINNNSNLLLNNLDTDPRTEQIFIDNIKMKSALFTPVSIKGDPYGAIGVFRNNQDFDTIDEQLITQFSQSVQMAIINMQLVNDVQSERERAEVTLHSIADAVITTNINGNIEYMNQAAETITAWKFEDIKNKAIQDIFRILDIDTREPFHDIVKSCLNEGISINKSKLILLTRNDNEKDIESSISPILNSSGQVEGIVIVFHDETQRRQLENTIIHQASHDPLTDLLNRASFDQELNRHVFDVRNSDRIHILCYLDLDRFKLVNDTAGHCAGDQCLIEIASLIQLSTRGDDIFARLGGDEFGLILRNCNIDAAVKITNNIINAVKSFKFNWDACDYNLGVSIGIVPISQSTKDPAEAIRKADLACYTAKDQGRGQVYIYEEQDNELIKRQKEAYWASRMREVLDNDRIKLYAQPIVPLSNKLPQSRHFEILVRLVDENKQLIQPDAFIPAAERYNLMHDIDKRIIHDTFKFISEQKTVCNNSQFSINLSGNSLSEGDIAAYIELLLNQYDINARKICFEITETAAIKNMKTTMQLIRKLKSIGCQFALDDFGTGLSSFQYLKNMHVDYLKIDGSFVHDMVNNKIDQAMVAAINQVGHIMGIKTIAEYVENDDIIHILKQLNVDYAQGYGIKKPQPLADFFVGAEKRTAINIQPAPTLKLVKNKS